MTEQINVGDIVFSKTHKVKGKVIKVKHYDRSVLVEVIIAFDAEQGIRTTKLHSFALSDVKLYKFGKRKKQKKKLDKKEESKDEDKTKTILKNAPKLNLTEEALKNIENAIKVNKLVNTPEIHIPNINLPDQFKQGE